MDEGRSKNNANMTDEELEAETIAMQAMIGDLDMTADEMFVYKPSFIKAIAYSKEDKHGNYNVRNWGGLMIDITGITFDWESELLSFTCKIDYEERNIYIYDRIDGRDIDIPMELYEEILKLMQSFEIFLNNKKEDKQK